MTEFPSQITESPLPPPTPTPDPEEPEHLASALESGKVCALAVQVQRDMQACADSYPGLFPSKPFEPTFISGTAMGIAFGCPWATPGQLRVSARTQLWIFAEDWLVDYVARSPDEVQKLVRRCLKVADGAPPDEGDELTRFLAELRDELAAQPAYAEHGWAWREQLRRMLEADAREWRWKATGTRPTLDDYLDNADNFGPELGNVGHWIRTCGAAALDRLDELRAAGQQVQRVLRLLNDLASYERDREWGDLNALMLGPGRDEVASRTRELVRNALRLIEPLRDACPREAVFLERQIGFSSGFYDITDYWGEL